MGILDNITNRSKVAAARKSDTKKDTKLKASTENKQSVKDSEKPANKSQSKKSKPVSGPLAKENAGKSSIVLVAPVLTEKAGKQESLGKYTFIVSPRTTKVEVAEAVRDLYGVKPVSVKIMKLKGKKVHFGRIQGRKKDTKKAIVTLKPGDSISLYE